MPATCTSWRAGWGSSEAGAEMIRHTRLLLWRIFAGLMVLLGMAGAVLPVLPTVPFLLVAAWAASRGWPSLEARLLAHPKHGPYIVRWRERGAVPRKAKW